MTPTLESITHQIDGYRKLFEKNNGPRIFPYKNKGLQVQVELFMFNDSGGSAAEEYRSYWTTDPGRIFNGAGA